jgi:PIN domain nuclease of toxin-antitoxin system
MSTLCDTHVVLFWAHEPQRLSSATCQALEVGCSQAELAIADISLWELALLLSRHSLFQHGDPADRLIGATALQLGAPLITADARLRALETLKTVW